MTLGTMQALWLLRTVCVRQPPRRMSCGVDLVAGFGERRITEAAAAAHLHAQSRVAFLQLDLSALDQFKGLAPGLSHYPRRLPPSNQSATTTILGDRIGVSSEGWCRECRAFDAQRATDKQAPRLLNTIDEPVPGGHGAYGRFGDRAHTVTSQIRRRRHRAVSSAVLALAAAAHPRRRRTK